MYLLALILAGAHAINVKTSTQTPFCESSNLKMALQSLTAYNVAFLWSKKADIKDWSFREKPVNGTAISCVEYTYQTRIRLPGTFAQYVGNLLRDIQIHKQACMVNNEYVEEVHVDKTSVISNLKSISHSRVKNNMLETDIDVTFDLPWYVSFIEPMASRHIIKSFREKFETLSSIVCNIVE